VGPASPPLVLPEVLPLVLPDVLPLVLPELLPLVLPDVLPELLPLPEPLLPPLPPSPGIDVVLLEHPPANEASGTATKATTLKAGLNFTAFLLGNDPLFESPRANGRHTSGARFRSMQTPFSMLHIKQSANLGGSAKPNPDLTARRAFASGRSYCVVGHPPMHAT
jgi:hypothetical protein